MVIGTAGTMTGLYGVANGIYIFDLAMKYTDGVNGVIWINMKDMNFNGFDTVQDDLPLGYKSDNDLLKLGSTASKDSKDTGHYSNTGYNEH
eukprot:16719-Heterococcus_DN1.PRE.1